MEDATDSFIARVTDGVDDAVGAAGAAAVIAGACGVRADALRRLNRGIANARVVLKVGKTAAATGAAISTATGLTVAATSGAGIASGLAAAGGIVGGGMAAGPVVLAGGPAALAAMVLNATAFREGEGLNPEEVAARSGARKATSAGAAVAVVSVGAATGASGASGAAIMGTLATVGGIVGGGALVGTAILVTAPVAVAGATGFAAYTLLKRKRKMS
jgi:hypothetical protein